MEGIRASDQLGEKRREIAARTILRHRDLVAEMFGRRIGVPAAHTRTQHRRAYYLVRAYERVHVRVALTRAPSGTGDAAAPVCSRCQTLWRPGVPQATRCHLLLPPASPPCHLPRPSHPRNTSSSSSFLVSALSFSPFHNSSPSPTSPFFAPFPTTSFSPMPESGIEEVRSFFFQLPLLLPRVEI